MGGGYFEKQKNGGRILQEAEKWGEYTWVIEKMGGVVLKGGKNGGSIVKGRKKWGEYRFAAEGRIVIHPPPQGVFGTFPKNYFHFSGLNITALELFLTHPSYNPENHSSDITALRKKWWVIISNQSSK